MERMKHTGDYELDEINMLEQECSDLEEENKKLRKTVVMQEMEYNQLLKSYNRLAKELEEAKANRSPFTIFKK